jgi:hypothetical protein
MWKTKSISMFGQNGDIAPSLKSPSMYKSKAIRVTDSGGP